MTRFTIISAIFLTGAFTTALANLHMPSQSAQCRFDDTQFDDKTREMVLSYYSFKSTLTATLELLAQGKICLGDAGNQVYEAALCHNPSYLKHLESCEQGTTPRERVARNLIGHLRSSAETNPAICVRIFALEIEFAELQRASPESCSTNHDAIH